jgi:hypothetical protein
MTWSRIEELLDAKVPIERVLADPGFWESEEAVFVRAATRLREKRRLREAAHVIQHLKKRKVKVSSKTGMGANQLLKG